MINEGWISVENSAALSNEWLLRGALIAPFAEKSHFQIEKWATEVSSTVPDEPLTEWMNEQMNDNPFLSGNKKLFGKLKLIVLSILCISMTLMVLNWFLQESEVIII